MNLGSIKAKNKNLIVSRYQSTAEIAGAIVKSIDESHATAEKLKKYFLFFILNFYLETNYFDYYTQLFF